MEYLRALLFADFQTFWTAIDPTPFPVEYENQPAARGVEPGMPYGRLTLVLGDERPASIGTRHTRCPGFLVLQIFMPEETGMKAATDVCELMRAHFNHRQLSATAGDGTVTQISIECVSFKSAGARSGHKQYAASANFRCDTHRPA